MIRNSRSESLTAAVLMAPFVVVYAIFFVYPTIKMVELSFTNAPLIGPGKWVGLDNYFRLASDHLFSTAVWNTVYFVILSVLPEHASGARHCARCEPPEGLDAERRARGLLFALHPARVGRLPDLGLDVRQRLRRGAIRRRPMFNGGQHLSVFRTVPLFMPAVAFITVWWCIGFSLLLFIAGLRNISSEIYEAAELDGAGRWLQFRRITWPLIWPVTVLVFTIQLILQLKIFDQVYLFTQGGRIDANMVMVFYILREAFQLNKGGLARRFCSRSVRGDRVPVRVAIPAPARARAT